MPLVDLTLIRTELSKDGHLRLADVALQRLFTTEEAARYLCISPWAVRNLVAKGRLSTIRIGRSVRFDVRDLEKFILKEKETKW